MTIYVFGDSYAVRYGTPSEPHFFMGKTGPLWYDIVEKESGEDVKIIADGGEGPYTAFDNFYPIVERGTFRPVKDKLVFFLSHQYRLPIDDHTNRINQPLCLDVLRGDKNTLLKNYEYEIFYLNEVLGEEIFRFNIKNLYFLKTLSELKNLKTYAFLCFDFNGDDTSLLPIEQIHKKVDLPNIYEIEKLNSDTFKLNSEYMIEVTMAESIYKRDYDNNVTFRANHMSFVNHRILANRILNYFYNSELDEDFKEDIITEKWGTRGYIYE